MGKREYPLPEQQHFSDDTKHLLLVKIKADMHNDMLADFLEIIVELQSPPGPTYWPCISHKRYCS